jgi:tetratricopeptide (TPR) repeat protein
LSNPENTKHDGTLMSKIAKDQLINYDSEKFYIGLLQYENNMRDILEMAKANKVPVILGILTNNLKDQPPFISVDSGMYPRADKVYENAKMELQFKHLHSADSLFRLAKDLDALRFRASEKMNQLIIRLGKEFNYSVVQIDSAFNASSPDGIVGNNLMTDHLHPTLEGYKLMSKLYFSRMKEMDYLPNSEPLQLTEHEQDSLTAENFKFSKLDSVVAEYRLKVLKNDWPFVNKFEAKSLSTLIKPNNFIEKTAYRLCNDRITWELAQREVAGWYLSEGDYAAFQNQMEVLISQYPVVVEYYDFAANELLKVERYDDAYKFLYKRYRIRPDVYSAKWLGIIILSKNKTDDAIKYLEESLRLGNNDPQVLYNISGAYSIKKEYQKALDAINKCLIIDAQFPKAVELKSQLQAVANKKAG